MAEGLEVLGIHEDEKGNVCCIVVIGSRIGRENGKNIYYYGKKCNREGYNFPADCKG